MKTFLAAVLAVLISSSAWADTLSYTNYSFVGGNITITDSGSTPSLNEYGGAGAITLTTAVTQQGPFYCVDIFDWLLGSGTYTVQAPDASLSAHDSNFISDASNLILHATENPSAGQVEAAQIAIWNLEYNGVVKNHVVSGPVTVTPDDPSVTPLVQAYYAFLGLNGSALGVGYIPGLNVLEEVYAAGNQTLIAEKIPEPASTGLLGVGLIALGLIARRPRFALLWSLG